MPGNNLVATAANAAQTSNWWLQYSFLIPVLATLIGWMIVSRQNDKRARRQEIRSLIDELRDRCDRAVEAADIYWSLGSKASERDGAAIKLKSSFPALTRIIRSIVAAGLKFDDWSHLVEMRQAATGGDFERKKAKPKAVDRENVLDIALAAEDLLGSVDRAYFSQFTIKERTGWTRFLPLLLLIGLSRDQPN